MLECYEFEECEYNGQPKCYLPDGMECPHGVKAHKPTNADRIRDMSDEELALQFGANCPKENRRACDRVCSKCWLEWLRQPSEEGT